MRSKKLKLVSVVAAIFLAAPSALLAEGYSFFNDQRLCVTTKPDFKNLESSVAATSAQRTDIAVKTFSLTALEGAGACLAELQVTRGMIDSHQFKALLCYTKERGLFLTEPGSEIPATGSSFAEAKVCFESGQTIAETEPGEPDPAQPLSVEEFLSIPVYKKYFKIELYHRLTGSEFKPGAGVNYTEP